MSIRLAFLLLAAGLLAACETAPPTPEQRADQCRMFRGYMSTQEHYRVMEACTRHMGEAACRECLWQ